MVVMRNFLGNIRAESDTEALDVVFVETPEYKGVVQTRDFNFIVGRRGTGKSALKYAAKKYFNKENIFWIFDIENNGHSMLTIQSILRDLNADYRILNHIMNITSKVAIYLEIIYSLSNYYKRKKLLLEDDLTYFINMYNKFLHLNFYERCYKILNVVEKNTFSAETYPGKIAEFFNIEKLRNIVEDSLYQMNKKVIFLFDNLDEGWTPMPLETSIIGGISHVAAFLKDRQSNMHVYVFSRDNMFRALAALDTDFTRNIEGSIIRLKWDDASLFHLVAERIKYFFKITQENHVKIWNRVAKGNISGREGFKICADKTLYRPRDILSLINQSFIFAAKDNRTEIIVDDIDSSAKDISSIRLNDLSNEYKNVFPALDVLVEAFKNGFSLYTYENIYAILENIIANGYHDGLVTSSFGIFSTPEDCLVALYSVGFIGVAADDGRSVLFCHDGATSFPKELTNKVGVFWIHPCYWDALSLQRASDISVVSKVYDDYSDALSSQDILDLRVKQIGKVITDIGKIELGRSGAHDFEDWVLRAVKILFSDGISNAVLHPNEDAIQRRDIVGTISTSNGFWGRVKEDFSCRQVIFEVKNYEELSKDDFFQLASYLGDSYGNFGIIVPRRKLEAPTKLEIGWLQEIWHRQKKVIFIIPESILIQCIKKQRSNNRFDYTEKTLNKRLDTFQRSYLELRHKR